MRIESTNVFDTHVHFRGHEKGTQMQRMMVNLISDTCAAAVAEPNTEPSILTGDDAVAYRDYLMQYTDGRPFIIVMAIKLNSSPNAPLTTPGIIYHAHELGVKVAKLYPLGTTTGAMSTKATGVVLNGPADLKPLYPAFEAMAACGMILQVHAQMPGVYCLDREERFMTEVFPHLASIEGLKTSIEHASCMQTPELATFYETGGCAITPHHALETTDYVIGAGLNAAGHCMPQLQGYPDRDAMARWAMSRHPRVWYGSDIAPRWENEKLSLCGCPGVFHGPYALPLLACVAERVLGEDEAGIQAALQHFTSDAACRFYGIGIPFRRTVTLVRTAQPITNIPKWYPVDRRQIPLFWGNEKIHWRIAKVTDE